MSILSAEGVSKRYRFRQVVRGITLEVRSGEVVGLLGPNGAGKTTAFYMIVGLIAADSGKILLDGQDLTAQPMHRRAKLGVGYLPQEASIFRKLSVEQNILAILENRDDLDQAGREEELELLLDALIWIDTDMGQPAGPNQVAVPLVITMFVLAVIAEGKPGVWLVQQPRTPERPALEIDDGSEGGFDRRCYLETAA